MVAQKVHGQVRYGELWIIHSSPVPGTPWVSDAGKQERSMGLESKTEWTSKLGEPMLATSPPHWCGLSLPRKTESLWKSYDTNLVSRMTPLSLAANIFINCYRPLSSRWMCSDSGPTTICAQPLESPCCWEADSSLSLRQYSSIQIGKEDGQEELKMCECVNGRDLPPTHCDTEASPQAALAWSLSTAPRPPSWVRVANISSLLLKLWLWRSHSLPHPWPC